MKQFRYTIIGIVCAAAFSCTSTESDNRAGETVEPAFTMDTRATISENPPADGSVFKLLTYTGTRTTITQEGYIYTKRFADYAYDENAVFGTAGGLVPINVAAADYYHVDKVDMTTVSKDRSQALHLLPNTTYRVAMVWPALDWRDCGDLGFLGVIEEPDWNVWASLPDDRNGDGTADDPFEINIDDFLPHEVPSDVKLYPLQSEIRVIFYTTKGRSYKMDNEEGAESVFLVNSGVNGFYSARTGVIYPNYNYKDDYYYSSDLILPDDDQTANQLNISEKLETVSGLNVTDPADGQVYAAQYQIQSHRVFQSDYRGKEGGTTLPEVLPMTLAVRINTNPDGTAAYNNASIPIAINILRNKRYTFYIDVQSTAMSVHYTMSDWDDVTYDDNELGTPPFVYVGRVSFNEGGWENGGYDEGIGVN